MDTSTGRIYEPAEFEQLRQDAQYLADDDLAALQADRRAELEALTAGRIVPVSDQVVQKVRLGERELNRRERRARARRS